MPNSSILEDLIARWEKEGCPAPESFCRDFPEHLAAFKEAAECIRAMESCLANEATTKEHKQKAQRPSGDGTPKFEKQLNESTPENAPTPSEDGVATPPNQNNSMLGRYRLVKCIGRGGFGEVWKAYHSDLKKFVAVKRPRTDRNLPKHQLELFRTEAQRAAHVKHPAIVPVFDVERDGDSWFIVSELIDGTSLKKHMATNRMPVEKIVPLVAAVADALHAAHRKRLIHRDVKPGNILIDQQGRPFLTDFGLALAEEVQHLEKDSVAGTYGYMSPEQLEGRSHFLDGRSDIYSLGIVLYELLTGERPFKGTSYKAIREQVLEREPKPPRAINESIPQELERICNKCLNKQIGTRYSTAADLARDLRASLRPPTNSRRRIRLAVGVSLCVGIGLGSAYFFYDKFIPNQAGLEVGVGGKQEFVHPKSNAESQLTLDGWRPLWIERPEIVTSPPSSETTLGKHSVLILSKDGTTIVKLGEVFSPSYQLSVKIEPYDWECRIAVFLGFRSYEDSAKTANFQWIRFSPLPFDKNKNELMVSRWLTRKYNVPFGGFPDALMKQYVRLPEKPLSGQLEISVVEHRLEEIRWNQTKLAELTTPQVNDHFSVKDYQGGFGFFVYLGSVRFYRPRIKVNHSEVKD